MTKLYYTLRFLLRGKGSNFIKIASLTLGLVVGLVLFSQVAFEMSYDNFYPDKGQIYQLQVKWDIKNGGVSEGDIVNAPFAPTMYQEFEEVIAGTTMNGWTENITFKMDERKIEGQLLGIDSMFFKTFGLKIVAGDENDIALPSTVFISQTMAKNVFGNEDPLGRLLQFNQGSFTVKGIFADIPKNSHLKFDLVYVQDPSSFAGWQNGDRYRGYVKLAPGITPEAVEAKIPDMMRKHYDVDAEIKKGTVRSYSLKPVTEIHTKNPDIRRSNLILSLLAFSLLFAAAMNYVLISISSLAKRAKAVGIHKCNGASEKSVFSMFLYETLILLSISLVLALLIILVFRGPIESLIKTGLTSIFSLQNVWVIVCIFIILLFTTGFIPAKIFSSIPVTQVFHTYADGKKYWKKSLLFAQFAGIAFMLTLLVIIVLQYYMIVNKDMGYATENILVSDRLWELPPEQIKTIKTEFERLPEIEAIALSSSLPSDGLGGSPVVNIETNEELFTGRFMSADADFFKTFEIQIVNGRGFTDNSIHMDEIIVNETLARKLNVDNPVGHKIEYLRKVCTICGVMKDYQTGSFYNDIFPVVIFPPFSMNQYASPNVIVMRLNRPLSSQLLSEYSEKLKIYTKNDEKSFATYKNMFYNEAYNDARLFRNSVTVAALIMLAISLLGLFGFVQDEVNRRRKEIAIRKVNGAKAENIIVLISKGISYIAIPAIVLGIVLSYIVGAEWLTQFVVKIPLNFILFTLSGLSILAILVFTVVTRSWAVAHENPVLSLKSE